MENATGSFPKADSLVREKLLENDEQGLPHLEMAGQSVFSYPEQGLDRALEIIEACLTKVEKGA